MKILFIIGSLDCSGGTERVTCDVANMLSCIGHDVEILSLFSLSTSNPCFYIEQSIKIKGLGFQHVNSNPKRFIRVSRDIFRHCRQSCPDFVIMADTILFLFCFPWVWRSKARFISWEHFNLASDDRSRFRRLARQAAAHLSDAVVVLTEYDAKAWKSRFNLGDRVHVIRNPMPPFEDGPSNIKDRKAIALAVGRLKEQKGFDVLLHAWHQLGEKRDGWVLRIVGEGADRPMLESLAESLGIQDSVQFPGAIRDMEREYRAASFYVLSSRWEGLSMTLVEAQHFALPSVAANCKAGPSEVLAGGTSGLLVQPENPKALADGMAKLMEDEKLRANLAEATSENARMFEPGQVRQSWLDLFDKLMAQK